MCLHHIACVNCCCLFPFVVVLLIIYSKICFIFAERKNQKTQVRKILYSYYLYLMIKFALFGKVLAAVVVPSANKFETSAS